jgi:hypothetical protein
MRMLSLISSLTIFHSFASQSTFDDHPCMTYIHRMKAIQKDKRLALFVPPEHKKCELRKASSSNIWEQLEPEGTPSSLTGNIRQFYATICENLLLSEASSQKSIYHAIYRAKHIANELMFENFYSEQECNRKVQRHEREKLQDEDGEGKITIVRSSDGGQPKFIKCPSADKDGQELSTVLCMGSWVGAYAVMRRLHTMSTSQAKTLKR